MPSARPCLSRRTLRILSATLAIGFSATFAEAQQNRDGAIDALRTHLDRLIRGPSWRDSRWGLLVMSLDHQDTLYAVDPERPLAPASNAKLLTTAAALHALGPDYRFLTYLLADAEVRDGVLDGDLTLYGTGDAGLSSRFYRDRDEVFEHLVDQLDEAGIREIRGDLVADASFLPGPSRPDGWDPEDLNDHFAAPVSALSFNENVVSVRITPARDVGSPPMVSTVPPDAPLPVVNEARTVPGSSTRRLAVLRDSPDAPVRIAGAIGAHARDAWRQLTIPDPVSYTAGALRQALERRGIEVRGTVRAVARPGRSELPRLSAPYAGKGAVRVLARHASEPLRTYLEVVNKQSHNLFAELIFRTVGRTVEGVGSPSASARAVAGILHQAGLDTTGLRLLDGSGLSTGNRVSPGALVRLLDIMERGRHSGAFWASLPEAGRPRELGRMYRTAAAGNLRAKTGTIAGVSALSGIVRAADGERLAFSMIVNDARSMTRAKATENQIGVRLASFERRAPPPASSRPTRVTTRSAERAGLARSGLSGRARHRVSAGENLTTIARRYELSLSELIEANPRVDPDRILEGEMLDIPERGELGGGF